MILKSSGPHFDPSGLARASPETHFRAQRASPGLPRRVPDPGLKRGGPAPGETQGKVDSSWELLLKIKGRPPCCQH